MFLLLSSTAAIFVFCHYYAKAISDYLFKRGQEASIQAQSFDAIIYFSWAVVFDPHNGDAYFYRGEERRRLGDIESAVPDYDLAVERSEFKSFFRSKRAELRISQHLYTKALTDLNDNIKELGDPDDYFTRAVLELIFNNPKDAKADLDAAIKVYPASKYLITRSQMEYTDGQLDATISDLRSAFISEKPKVSSELLLWLAQSENSTQRSAADKELDDYLQSNAATEGSFQVRIGLFFGRQDEP